MNVCICGTVKNCAKYLQKNLENMEKIGALFQNYKILIFYDHSEDDSLQILQQYQTNRKNKLWLYVNQEPRYPFRTYNLAKARNRCINYVKKHKDQYPFFVMMDMDDVNCKTCHPEVLRSYLHRTDWDALSFQTSPAYYDIWALSIYPFCFSYNHFHNNQQQHHVIQNYIQELLRKTREKPMGPNKPSLLPCISAFNGFAIYRTSKFLNAYYDGHIRDDLFLPAHLKAHANIAKSPLIAKKYETVNGFYEDCEHRAFHRMGFLYHQAKIRISPECVFT